MDDPWCGYPLCAGVWQDLIAAMLVTAEVTAVAAALRKDLPIYILSGSDDPTHNKWAAIERLVDNYRQCGLERGHSKAVRGWAPRTLQRNQSRTSHL